MLYPIAIEAGTEEQAYGVIVPDIPGCFSAGDTLEEALTNAKEAIAAHLELLAEDGDDIPFASGPDKHVHNAEYKGLIWALVDIDISRYLGKTEKVNVSLPSRLIHQIDARVKAPNSHYSSRSAFLAAGAEKLLHSSKV